MGRTGVKVGGTGVSVGGTGVSVGGTGVSVGGTGVSVGGTGVSVGGFGVCVGVGDTTAVGGTMLSGLFNCESSRVSFMLPESRKLWYCRS